MRARWPGSGPCRPLDGAAPAAVFDRGGEGRAGAAAARPVRAGGVVDGARSARTSTPRSARAVLGAVEARSARPLDARSTATMVQISPAGTWSRPTCASRGASRPTSATTRRRRSPSTCAPRPGAARRAAEVGPACAALIGGLLADNALFRLRAAQGVLGLADKHQPGRLEAACAKATAAGDPSYRTVKGILAAGTETDPRAAPAGDGGAAAFLHGPDALFAAGNVVALHPAIPGAEAAS